MDDIGKNTEESVSTVNHQTLFDERDGAKRFTSESLFLGAKELSITHGAEEYKLRITRYGKLILTK
ncbi:MAG: hemin uptake protein HemP [Methylophilaceae bacterium]